MVSHDDEIGDLLATTRDTDDWSPWLVLADALTERGDDRGALIRAQYRLHTGALDPDERGQLAQWSLELESTYKARWAEEALPGEPPPGLSLGWDRGFVTQAYVRRVAVDVVDYLDRLRARPLGAALDHVQLLAQRPRPSELEHLLSADFATQIRSWSFARQALGPAHAPILARRLAHARVLDLRANALGDGGLVTLAETRLASLESLHLDGNGFGHEGLLAIAGAPWPALRALLLVSCRVGPTEAGALGRAIYADQLEVLQMPNAALGRAGARGLLGRTWPRLEVLNLAWNQLGDEGLDCLDPGVLPRLRRLGLQGNTITSPGLRRFAGKPWVRLRLLDLRLAEVDPEAVAGCDFEVVL